MEYVNGIAFINYLIENKDNNKFINNIIQSYIHLLKGFNILVNNNIVHPERYVVSCNEVSCSRKEVSPSGLGDGRNYN